MEQIEQKEAPKKRAPRKKKEVVSEDNNTAAPQQLTEEEAKKQAEITAEQVRMTFHRSAINLHASFKGKPFNIYGITKRTNIKEPREAAELMGVLESLGLATSKGKGVNAEFTINLTLEQQISSVQQQILIKEIELRDMKLILEQLTLGLSQQEPPTVL